MPMFMYVSIALTERRQATAALLLPTRANAHAKQLTANIRSPLATTAANLNVLGMDHPGLTKHNAVTCYTIWLTPHIRKVQA